MGGWVWVHCLIMPFCNNKWVCCKFIRIYSTSHDSFTSLHVFRFSTSEHNFERQKTSTSVSLWPWLLGPTLQIMEIFEVTCTSTSTIHPNLRQYCIFYHLKSSENCKAFRVLMGESGTLAKYGYMYPFSTHFKPMYQSPL